MRSTLYLDDLYICSVSKEAKEFTYASNVLQVANKPSAWLALTLLPLLGDLVFHVTHVELLSLRVLQRKLTKVLHVPVQPLPVALRGLCVRLLVCVLPL